MHVHIRPTNDGTCRYAIDEYTVNGVWTGTTYKPTRDEAEKAAVIIQRVYEPVPLTSRMKRGRKGE